MAHGVGMVNRDQAVLPSKYCPDGFHSITKQIEEKLLEVNGVLILSFIFVAGIIWVGVYKQRYRHHHLTHPVWEVANLMFLPIITWVVDNSAGITSTLIPSTPSEFATRTQIEAGMCNPDQHSVMVITWALLVQIIIINTRVMIAVHHRETPSTKVPKGEIFQAVWTLLLGLKYVREDIKDKMFLLPVHRHFIFSGIFFSFLEVSGFLLNFAKIIFKIYAFKKADKSFSFALNPGFVSAYMKRLEESAQAADQHAPLLVMGEGKSYVREENDRFEFTQEPNGLVTINHIEQFLDTDNSIVLLPAPTRQRLKDLCLSFSLFKLLRCRLTSTELTHASSQNILWSLLNDGGQSYEKKFGFIVDELSFVQDYYNSSLTIFYSMHWLQLVGILISVWTIIHCITITVWVIICIDKRLPQMYCIIRCNDRPYEDAVTVTPGSMTINLVLLAMISLLMIASEVWDIVSYMFSNWAKVFQTCYLSVNNGCCLPLQKLYTRLLPSQNKVINKRWDGTMKQCSVLYFHPGIDVLGRMKRIFQISDSKIKLDTMLRSSIIDALINSRTDDGIQLRMGQSSLIELGEGGLDIQAFYSTFNSHSVSKVILSWQIATSMFRVMHTDISHASKTATHLSQYCVYLVSHCPTLLPGNNNDKWSQKLYKEVTKDAENALGQSWYSLAPNMPTYQMLEHLLNTKSNHQVVKNGLIIAQQLVALHNPPGAWKLLENFWVEMVLYVAPSDNLEGHKKAIALGGELVTVLWALLYHLGNVNKLATMDGVADG